MVRGHGPARNLAQMAHGPCVFSGPAQPGLQFEKLVSEHNVLNARIYVGKIFLLMCSDQKFH